MSVLEAFEVDDWSADVAPADRERAVTALEAGRVVYFPRLAFKLKDNERAFLDPATSDGKSKNVAFDPRTGTSHGSSADGESAAHLDAMMARYASATERLLKTICPEYADHLTVGRTSYRPLQVGDRASSWRKDDRRLHVDSFPSSPMGGRRILRFFSNVNPNGQARVWHVGEPFEDYARRFLPRVSRQYPGSGWAMQRLGITKGRRTPYDHIMLQLHDRGKEDENYQREGPQTEVEFPPETTWIVYTDQTLHAALVGQYAFEQTFYLGPEAMRDAESSPLRTLERLTGRTLT